MESLEYHRRPKNIGVAPTIKADASAQTNDVDVCTNYAKRGESILPLAFVHDYQQLREDQGSVH